MTARLPRTPLLADAVARRLRRAIVSGRYKVAQKLPTERELAERYDVSRAVVREALGRLKQDGLVVSRQGSGAFVTAGGRAAPRPGIPGLADAWERDDVIELLVAFGSAASALAARRRGPAELSSIEAGFAAMDRAIALGASGEEEDAAFHRAIIAATRSRAFHDMAGFLDGSVRHLARPARAGPARPPAPSERIARQAREEHLAILAAIRAGDEGAARLAAAAHLRRMAERLMGPPADAADGRCPPIG